MAYLDLAGFGNCTCLRYIQASIDWAISNLWKFHMRASCFQIFGLQPLVNWYPARISGYMVVVLRNHTTVRHVPWKKSAACALFLQKEGYIYSFSSNWYSDMSSTVRTNTRTVEVLTHQFALWCMIKRAVQCGWLYNIGGFCSRIQNCIIIFSGTYM